MKIIITGSAGFIGVNLCKKLLCDGHTIIGIDNFYCSSPQNMEELHKNKNFSFVEHDIIKPLDINEKIDAICNFACPASPKQYLKDPIYTGKVNVLGILNVLELAYKHNAILLQASTSETYGDPLEHPQTEQYWGNVNFMGPRACYDEGKRMAETFCFDFIRLRSIKLKLIRIFNTYGPYMACDDGRVMSNFITQALEGKPLTIYGEGEQTRSFCYIDDLVEGIVKYLYIPIANTNTIDHTVHGPINLGNPYEITINTLTKQISKHIPEINIVYKPLPENDPQQRKPDIRKAISLLQWTPRVQLKEGIKKTIEWIRNRYNNIR